MYFEQNYIEPVIGLVFRQPRTRAIVNNTDFGMGTVYVTNSYIKWIGEQPFSFSYSNLSSISLNEEEGNEKIILFIENDADAEGGHPQNQPENNGTDVFLITEDLTLLSLLRDIIEECKLLYTSPPSTTESDDANDLAPLIDAEAGGDGEDNNIIGFPGDVGGVNNDLAGGDQVPQEDEDEDEFEEF